MSDWFYCIIVCTVESVSVDCNYYFNCKIYLLSKTLATCCNLRATSNCYRNNANGPNIPHLPFLSHFSMVRFGDSVFEGTPFQDGMSRPECPVSVKR